MPNRLELRPANRKTKLPLSKVVRETERLWRRYHLTYDQAVEAGKHVRVRLELERPAKRRTVVDRLSQDESNRFIAQAYRAGGQRGLLVKTLLLSGARVSEFVAIRADDFYLEEAMLHIRKGKGRKEQIGRIPLIGSIYRASKQVTQTVLGPGSKSYWQVVLIPWPHRDSYALAFVTGSSLGEVQEETERDVVCVFVPTTPNPTSGFILMVPKDDVIELEMTVDEAFKMIVSLGVVVPTWPRNAIFSSAARPPR